MLPNYPMPFRAVPCSIWLAQDGGTDAYNNQVIEYNTDPDITTVCVYTPGTSKPSTSDDIEESRPYGDTATVTFYLPKSVSADLRNARIACYPTSDTALSGRLFDVVGNPYSYQRENTPGDYSWVVEGIEHLG